MKTLYLVRHAKSSWDYPNLDDIERPLNKRGKRDAPEMGKRLSERGVLPDLMLTSPAERALTTCQHIAKALKYPAGEIEIDHRVYHAGVNQLLKVVQETDTNLNSVMLFGHNPGFTDFANALANTDIYNIPTCGVFACTFIVDNWMQLSFGKGRVEFYDYPKKISS